MTARMINEGATLIIEDEGSRLVIECDTSNIALAEEVYKAVNAANELQDLKSDVAHRTRNMHELVKQNLKLNRCVGFFKSVIQCGEKWSETCQKMYDDLK